MSCPYCKENKIDDREEYEIAEDHGFNEDGNFVAIARCLTCGKEFIQIYAVEIDWDNPIENIKKEDYKEE